MLTRDTLPTAKRLVVKVGTSTLTDASGRLDRASMDSLARQITDLFREGKEVVLVTSAAISAGMQRMGLKERPSTIPGKQAAAAVGQGILMREYEKLFAGYGQMVGQILMTREDSVKRTRYAHLRNTFNALLEQGIVPIVNENDAVAVEEVKIGDNDTLSAQVASIVDADLLLILSDVDGVYDANPSTNATARLLSEIPEITREVEAAAGGAGSSRGTGGMFTKIEAAKVAVSAGICMVIASGGEENVLKRVLRGEPLGTLFLSKESRLQFRKRWLAFGARVKGKIFVDAGCARALKNNSSLLPAGVVAVEGSFETGSTVSVAEKDGQEIARGLVSYSDEEVRRLKGAKTSDIAAIIGHKAYDEIIHRDNLVLMSGGK